MLPGELSPVTVCHKTRMLNRLRAVTARRYSARSWRVICTACSTTDWLRSLCYRRTGTRRRGRQTDRRTNRRMDSDILGYFKLPSCYSLVKNKRTAGRDHGGDISCHNVCENNRTPHTIVWLRLRSPQMSRRRKDSCPQLVSRPRNSSRRSRLSRLRYFLSSQCGATCTRS